MKKWVAPLMLGFGVTLAYIIGQKMSTDAMAVVIGVAVGVAASVPMSVLLVALLRRERRPAAPAVVEPAHGFAGQYAAPYPQFQPPVIVINPADFARQPLNMPLPPVQMAQDGGVRGLRVVGGNEWGD